MGARFLADCAAVWREAENSPAGRPSGAIPDHEETTDPLVADGRNFYKVEKWTRDGTKVDSLHYAGNSFGRARAEFEHAIKRRPAHPADNPAADAGAGAVVTARNSTSSRRVNIIRLSSVAFA